MDHFTEITIPQICGDSVNIHREQGTIHQNDHSSKSTSDHSLNFLGMIKPQRGREGILLLGDESYFL